MPPGLTCLWAIRGRNELRRSQLIELDQEYVRDGQPAAATCGSCSRRSPSCCCAAASSPRSAARAGWRTSSRDRRTSRRPGQRSVRHATSPFVERRAAAAAPARPPPRRRRHVADDHGARTDQAAAADRARRPRRVAPMPTNVPSPIVTRPAMFAPGLIVTWSPIRQSWLIGGADVDQHVAANPRPAVDDRRPVRSACPRRATRPARPRPARRPARPSARPASARDEPPAQRGVADRGDHRQVGVRVVRVRHLQHRRAQVGVRARRPRSTPRWPRRSAPRRPGRGSTPPSRGPGARRRGCRRRRRSPG